MPVLGQAVKATTLPDGFEDIGTAERVEQNTVADLLMASGRICRATWRSNGRVRAWWPMPGQGRKHAIALYEPMGWKPVDNVVPLPRRKVR